MNLHRLDLVSQSLVGLVVRTGSINRGAQLAHLAVGAATKRICDREGTVDNTGANTAAVRELIADSGLDIQPHQSKYLNHFVEKDHRAIKRHVRPLL